MSPKIAPKTTYRFAGREDGRYLWIGEMPFGNQGKTAPVSFSCDVTWFWSVPAQCAYCGRRFHGFMCQEAMKADGRWQGT